ncbi:pentapeptide repeat-containing protein [Arthrobacter sp. ov118]|uniref:pentapeptide repeat-containing protein n=1 Tax=Arthrobacter sp. ov118 TaxID=1761747 RepID=UPI000B8399DB
MPASSSSRLSGARLSGARLGGASLSGARLSACGRSTWSNTVTPCSNDSKAAKSKAVRTGSVTRGP